MGIRIVKSDFLFWIMHRWFQTWNSTRISADDVVWEAWLVCVSIVAELNFHGKEARQIRSASFCVCLSLICKLNTSVIITSHGTLAHLAFRVGHWLFYARSFFVAEIDRLSLWKCRLVHSSLFRYFRRERNTRIINAAAMRRFCLQISKGHFSN